MTTKFTSITVAELKDLLDSQDPEAIVTFESNYGDHARTRQVHQIHGGIEELPIRESGYSESGFAIDKDAADDDEQGRYESAQKVLVIS